MMPAKITLSYLLLGLLSVAGFYPAYLLFTFLLDHFIGTQELAQAFLFEGKRELLLQVFSNWFNSLPASLATSAAVVMHTVYYPCSSGICRSLAVLLASSMALAILMILFSMPPLQVATFVLAIWLLSMLMQLIVRFLPDSHA